MQSGTLDTYDAADCGTDSGGDSFYVYPFGCERSAMTAVDCGFDGEDVAMFETSGARETGSPLQESCEAEFLTSPPDVPSATGPVLVSTVPVSETKYAGREIEPGTRAHDEISERLWFNEGGL